MTKRERGLYLRLPGTRPDDWSIRYVDAQGRQRKEHVGQYSLAIKLLAKRRGEAVQGKKLPETLRRKTILFDELADDARTYIEKRYSRPSDDLQRLERVRSWFAGRVADSIRPFEIRAALDKSQDENRWSSSSRNHFHNLISLCYRLAVENEKIDSSPIHRKVRKSPERNDNNRYFGQFDPLPTEVEYLKDLKTEEERLVP
jgi:hypothetical protein